MNSLTPVRVVIVALTLHDMPGFPGLPLAAFLGMPLVQNAHNLATQVDGSHKIAVAVDDERVAQMVRDFGGRELTVGRGHRADLAAVAEAAQQIEADLYVSLGLVEPAVRPEHIAALIEEMRCDCRLQAADYSTTMAGVTQ